jgi:hypothetical protein
VTLVSRLVIKTDVLGSCGLTVCCEQHSFSWLSKPARMAIRTTLSSRVLLPRADLLNMQSKALSAFLKERKGHHAT